MVLPTLVHKITNGGIGINATIRSFLNVAVTELLLAQLKQGSEHTSFMSLMDEPRLMPAVKAMFNEPATRHSVGSLAETCFMSRSSFATKFSETYGIGPMEFLRDVRLNSAANLLMQQSLTIESVGQLSGFQSRSAFSRAFFPNSNVRHKLIEIVGSINARYRQEISSLYKPAANASGSNGKRCC